MSAENWDKIKEIFLEAIELAPAERARFLTEKCGDDQVLRREVEDLIRADEEAETLMSRPAIEENAAFFSPESFDERDPLIGKTIGAYRLIEELGRGGMGTVYLAERADGSFRQKTAVKLIKRGMDTDFILRRFRRERQVLAALNHPNIAQLYDGGTTTDNLPYFVMEHVEGETLYHYSDEHKLSIKERLELFCQICAAIDFAHQKQIVHRDLKPSNILVKTGGAVKLLDFGIAKVLDSEADVSMIDPTQTSMRLMTPEYASPEQVSGLPVTFASDIYSLGVVLYELLTGHRPYRFKSRAAHEIARVICEEEPDRPGASLTREDNLLPTGAGKTAALSDIYLARGMSDVEALKKELSGEIEKVILKCLRKNADERYQTAAALAEDIKRCLNGEKVEAEILAGEQKKREVSASAGESGFWRNGKYRLALAAILAVLIFGAAASVYVFNAGKSDAPGETNNQPTAKRSVAVLPFKNETASAENDFLCDGLSENLISRLSYLPEIQVMSRSAAFKYKNAQVSPEQAGKEMNVAAVLAGKVSKAGDDKISVFLELIDVSDGSQIWSAQYDGKDSEMVFLQNKMAGDVAAQFKTGKPNDQRQIASRGYTENSGAFEFYLKGEFERQKATAEGNRKSIEYYRRALEFDPNYALAFQGLALSCRIAPAYRTLAPEEAYPLAKESALKALAIDPTLGTAYLPLASIKFAYDWDFAGAENEYRQAIRLAPNNAEVHSSYSTFLSAMGRHEEALSELKIAQQFDPQSPAFSGNIAWALCFAGRFDEAEAQLKQLLKRDPDSVRDLSKLGEVYTEQGKFEEANEVLQKAKRLSNDVLTQLSIAHFYAVSGRRAEALKMTADFESKAEKKELPPFLLAEVYAGLNDRDKAFFWLERAFQERSNWLVFTKVSRRLKPLHSDARFDELLNRIGFLN